MDRAAKHYGRFTPIFAWRLFSSPEFPLCAYVLSLELAVLAITIIRNDLYSILIECTSFSLECVDNVMLLWKQWKKPTRVPELSTLPHSAGASRNFIEHSGISRNRVRLPPGVIISRICEILPRLDCLPLISWPSARKYIDLTWRAIIDRVPV